MYYKKYLLLVLLGLLVGFFGFSLNSTLLNTAENNLGISDNDISKNVTYLHPITSDNNQNIKFDMLNNPLFCQFFDYKEQKIVNINLLTPIGNYFYLPTDIDQSNLVYIKNYGINSTGNYKLSKEAADNLIILVQDLKKANISYTINSAYRSISDQNRVYKNYVAGYGIDYAQSIAAKPGFSEHNLGNAIDILTNENNLRISSTFQKTKLAKWLEKNSYKYGFVQSFPKKTNNYNTDNFEIFDSPIGYEPWHYRYIGKTAAEEYVNANIPLFDFLFQLYNYCKVEKISSF